MPDNSLFQDHKLHHFACLEPAGIRPELMADQGGIESFGSQGGGGFMSARFKFSKDLIDGFGLHALQFSVFSKLHHNLLKLLFRFPNIVQRCSLLDG